MIACTRRSEGKHDGTADGRTDRNHRCGKARPGAGSHGAARRPTRRHREQPRPGIVVVSSGRARRGDHVCGRRLGCGSTRSRRPARHVRLRRRRGGKARGRRTLRRGRLLSDRYRRSRHRWRHAAGGRIAGGTQPRADARALGMTDRRGSESGDATRAAWLKRARTHLRKADPVLARIIDRDPAFDPRAWLDEIPPMDIYGAALFQVTGQQLSVAALTAISGIGPWTAQGVLLVALRREDVVLPGDLALRKAIRNAYQLDRLPSEQEVLAMAEKWRPYRSLATSYLFASAFDSDDAK